MANDPDQEVQPRPSPLLASGAICFLLAVLLLFYLSYGRAREAHDFVGVFLFLLVVPSLAIVGLALYAIGLVQSYVQGGVGGGRALFLAIPAGMVACYFMWILAMIFL